MSRIIASYHDFTDKYYSTAEISKIFKDLQNGGQSDIVKVPRLLGTSRVASILLDLV